MKNEPRKIAEDAVSLVQRFWKLSSEDQGQVFTAFRDIVTKLTRKPPEDSDCKVDKPCRKPNEAAGETPADPPPPRTCPACGW